jgi:hypothetical protein
VGDLVEVQLTAAAIPIKNARYKMILSMRTVAIIDSDFTEVTQSLSIYHSVAYKTIQEAAIRSAAMTTNSVRERPTIKRRIGYVQSDDEVIAVRQQFVNMSMNEDRDPL